VGVGGIDLMCVFVHICVGGDLILVRFWCFAVKIRLMTAHHEMQLIEWDAPLSLSIFTGD